MLLAERFWPKVDVRGADDCWRWLAARTSSGYGHIKVDGRMVMAHRVAYELLIGPIPEGLVIDHLCRTPLCMNPAHMEPVTRGENVRRGESISTVNRAKTHCPKGHPYAGRNLYVNRAGDRRCRECDRAAHRTGRPPGRPKKLAESEGSNGSNGSGSGEGQAEAEAATGGEAA